VAVGYLSLQASTTANNNVAVGTQALNSNTTASNNTAVGYQAGYGNTTGTANAFLGYLAGYANTTGGGNTFLGNGAGQALTTTNNSTHVGNIAGTASSGAQNTFLGSFAGYLCTTGASNTIIGRYSGNQGGLDIRTASNYIVLSDGDGNPRGIFTNDGSLLVGTTALNAVSNYFSYDNGSGIVRTGHVNGAASGTAYSVFAYNGGNIGSITQSGTTAVLYNVTSDQRLKENIVDAPEFGSVIDSIQVRSYDWKTDNTHQRAGFIAQELVTVAPEAVHQPADTDEMMAVDYSKLVPMLVKEIQSLRKRLADAGIA
jgi:hypothetical protein